MSLANNCNEISNPIQVLLKQYLDNEGVRDYKIETQQGSLPGDNFVGTIVEVEVRGKNKQRKEVTLNFVLKCAPSNEIFRQVASVWEIYDREIYVYSKMFPEFIRFQQGKNVKHPFRSFPKYCTSTMENLHETVVLENMKSLGFEAYGRHRTLDYNHVLLVMKEYGRLHALSFALRDQEPELFQRLSENMKDKLFRRNPNEFFKQKHELAYKSLDPTKDKVACEKFLQYKNHFADRVFEAVQPELAGKYSVLGHGDCWINNMLFKYSQDEEDVPMEVCLLDWQLARVGSPALDLSYFLLSCTSKALRDKYYKHFIQEYYDSLSLFLRELGSDPEQMFPFAVLQEHMKKYSIYGLHMAILVLFIMACESDEIPNREEEERSIRNVERYNEMIRGVILDFIELDYDF